MKIVHVERVTSPQSWMLNPIVEIILWSDPYCDFSFLTEGSSNTFKTYKISAGISKKAPDNYYLLYKQLVQTGSQEI